MAQQHSENISDVNITDEQHTKSLNLIHNGSDSNTNSSTRNSNSIRSNVSHQATPVMNDKISNIKSPSGQGGQSVGGNGGSGPTSNNGNDVQQHPYSSDNSMTHYQHSQNLIGSGSIPADIPGKEEGNSYVQTASGLGPTGPGGHHSAYPRYHLNDPNLDPYRYGHSPIQPNIGKPPPPGISSTNRPSQRYIPGQSPQGPTPTLNSLLQSHPPPPQHRYANNYDPISNQQQSSSQQPQQHPVPPPSHQPYVPQQVWAPPPRPYSPQLGPSQAYRTPPPANSTRGQSPYPPSHGQGTVSYPSSPQQPSGPPPPTPNQSSGSTQYSPYPQRYPTPPGVPSSGPNHRSTYSTHQYPDPNRPWPGGSSPVASPGPGGHPHPPASPHQIQHGVPPPNSPGHAPSPSPQPSQASPSPHQELLSQNSNDSSSGGVGAIGSGPPGTPNPQQVMRPTPSPTGSSGSRSMSPAVGQQNITRPSSNQSQSVSQMPPTTSVLMSHNSNASNTPPSQQPQSQGNLQGLSSNTQQSSPHLQHSHPSNNMQTQGNYPTQPPISHLHGYKIGPGSGQGPGPNPQNMSPYPPPQTQQYPQGNYSPRPPYSTNYAPAPPPTNQANSANNMPPGPNQYQGRPMSNHSSSSHSQFPPYQQNWVPTSQHMGNQGQGKGTPPPPAASNVGAPRPINYLKQHLQHKVSYIGNSIPTPPQGYGNGPSMHLPMGPPHHMGPPTTNMGPPTTTPAVSGGNSAMPPQGQDGNLVSDHNSVSQDNGVSSSGGLLASNTHQVTSVITTGPDGTLLDDASQQSSLSNASAASGEDPQCTTPKSRKNDLYNQSHLAPPSTSPSGHPHSDDFEINSPTNWSRTPGASPQVFNSHGPTGDTYRASTKKSDSLCKLYDMDENPDRRGWLDKLLGFMDERRTPITACPTISKQPLDLYRLYIYVKERGGFVEVTKSKTWKDIAGLLGIGASSSAAYTLRKHYTKNLLAFECHFDRGGIDPLPIIQQVEAGTKKKSTKPVSVPSPGSSNSQDSFPPPGPANTSIDGYAGYPASGYQPGSQSDYNTGSQLQRPPSQNNAQVQHTGSSYPGQPGYNQYGPAEQYSSAGTSSQYTQNQSQFVPPNRPMYPPVYGPDGEGPSTPSNSYAQYGSRPYSQATTGSTQAQTPVGNSQGSPGPGNTQPPSGSANSYAAPPPPPPTPQEYYRPTESPQPRRHPDFVKDSQPGYPGYNQRPPIYAGWQGNTVSFRGQYPSSPGPQPWASGPRTTGPPQNHQISQWSDQHRYPSQSQPPYQSSQQQQQQQQLASSQQQQQPQIQQPWNNLPSTSQQGQGSALRPPPQRMPGGKPFNMPPPQKSQSNQPIGGIVCVPQATVGNFPSAVVQVQKKDIVFPPESVEATTPVLYRRKRLTRSDVCPIDPWRIFMSLRSGLLAESTWALDILNILLFDDTAVQYFGLAHLPGLLNLLLEHFQKNLSEMFDNENDISITSISSHNKKRFYENNCRENVEYLDLGQVTQSSNPEERVVLLSNTPNYTLITRKGVPVRIQNSDDDIFVSENIKDWDYDSNKNYQLNASIGTDPWSYGQTELYPHDGIIDVFKSEIVDIPFARYIVKCSRKDKEADIMNSIDKLTDIDVDNGREIGFQQFGKRRRMSFNKNGFADLKKPKLFGSLSTDFKFEIKKEPKCDESSEGKTNNTLQAQPDKKKENLDSDCREVDMDIEPRVPNGTQIIGRIQIENEIKFASKNLTQNLKNSKFRFDPLSTIRDPATVLHRRRISEYEDECYTRDESSLYLINECQDSLARRCICLSNIFRNLTFVPGNETILAKSAKFLALLGKLLLLNHEHLMRTPKTRNYDREEDTDFSDSCSSLQGEKEWWWEYLIHIRENMLVVIANLAGHLELSHYEEIITRPVLDGLLHWAVCPSAHGQDPFPSCGPNTALSPQRLALEALCKLCVTDANVDLVIATPPFSRLEKLCAVLTRHLCRNEDQVLREFSVNLLHYLAAADSAMSRTVALQSPCISYLVAFIEQAEQTALGVANQHGINYLRENPDSMGTSLDMLRRAAGTLLHLSKHPDNRSLFMQQEQRLLGLVMSHILDQQVALIISRVLFQVSRGPGSITSMEYRLQQRQQNVKTLGLQRKPVSSSGDIINNSIKSINSSIVTTALLSSSNAAIPTVSSPIKSNSSTAAITLSSTSLPSSQSLNFSTTNLKTHNINTRRLNLSSSSNNYNKSDETALNDISNSSSNSSSNSCNSSTNAVAVGNSNISSGLISNSSISSMENLSGNKNNISTTTATITGNSNNNSNSSITTTSTAAVA